MIIREAISYPELHQVYKLTHDAYVDKGYIEPRCDDLLIHYPNLERIKETTVLIAEENGQIIGTNSLTLDNEFGLHCERDFPLQVMQERLTGLPLCCSWRIVTRKDIRDDWRIVYALIKATTQKIIQLKYRILLMTFHPMDALRYLRILNAEVDGFCHNVAGLHNAPALLVRGDVLNFPYKLTRNINELTQGENHVV